MAGPLRPCGSFRAKGFQHSTWPNSFTRLISMSSWRPIRLRAVTPSPRILSAVLILEALQPHRDVRYRPFPGRPPDVTGLVVSEAWGVSLHCGKSSLVMAAVSMGCTSASCGEKVTRVSGRLTPSHAVGPGSWVLATFPEKGVYRRFDPFAGPWARQRARLGECPAPWHRAGPKPGDPPILGGFTLPVSSRLRKHELPDLVPAPVDPHPVLAADDENPGTDDCAGAFL